MATIFQDFRYALRLLRRNPGITLAACAALTLGIGSTTTMFSVVSAVLLRPLPVKNPKQIVEIFQTERDFPRELVSMQDFVDWKASLQSFQQLALYRPGVANLTGTGKPELVRTLECDGSMLPLLGSSPVLGRNFAQEENLPGRDGAVLLSWEFWQSRFGGENLSGTKILLGGKPYIIIGVLPRGLRVPAQASVWIPIAFDLKELENTRGYHYYRALGRLKDGVSLEAANSELRRVSKVLAEEYPKHDKDVSAQAIPFEETITGDVRRPLLILFGAVASVLLIACVNVAHLLLVKSSMRTRELSIRIALGATRARVLAQLLTESMLLAAISATAGICVAAAGVRLARGLERMPIPHPEDITMDWRVLLFAVITAAASAILFGCMPAVQAWRTDVNASLKQASGRTTETRAEQNFRKLFVFGQAALATLLLISALLFLRSFANLARVKTGLRANSVLTMYLTLSGYKFGDSQAVGRVAEGILSRVSVLPGIRSVAFSQDAPLLTPGGGEPLLIQGEALPQGMYAGPPVIAVPVSKAYFRTLGIPLLYGRTFEERDSPADVSTAIVNEALVRAYFGGGNPLHKRVSLLTEPLAWKEIVGVVGDVPQTGLDNAIAPQIYLPLAHLPMPRLTIVRLCLLAKAEEPPLRFANAIEQNIHEVEPDTPVVSVRTLDDLIRQQLGWRAVQTSLLTAFSALALLLTSLGIYAVIAYSVSQRISEIGTRMAVGASERDISRMILIQGMAPAAGGALAGMACAAALGTVVSNLLFGIRAMDWPTYAAVFAIQLLTAFLAAYAPARRAARVEPWKALRYE